MLALQILHRRLLVRFSFVFHRPSAQPSRTTRPFAFLWYTRISYPKSPASPHLPSQHPQEQLSWLDEQPSSLKFYFNNRRDRTASTCTAILCTLCPAITLGDYSYPADSTFTPLTRQHAGRRIEAFPRSWAGIRYACSAPFPINLLLLSCQMVEHQGLEP